MSGNTRFFATATVGLAAVACLVASACARGGRASAPKGSLTEAVACEGKQIERIDVNEDGRADIEHVVRGGRRVCTKADMNFDGKIDVTRFYENDGVTVAFERYDFDFDGRVDQLSFYENGVLVRKELDTTFNNSIDTWLWCEDGWVSRSERDRKANGQPDVWEAYDQGLIIEARYDENDDGRPDRWDVFRGGKLVLTKYDDDGDGEPDRTDEMPIHSLGPADDALRCEPTTAGQIASASTDSPAAQGSKDASQGVAR